jgi:phosphonate C-P lyase system protein PhnG
MALRSDPGAPDTLARLVELVGIPPSLEMIRPACSGLLLATVVESVEHQAFHPGEILVSSCEVRVHGCVGRGIVLGRAAEAAEHCAILDAYLQGPGARRAEILEALAEESRRRAARQRAEREMVQATSVRFDTMDPQRP